MRPSNCFYPFVLAYLACACSDRAEPSSGLVSPPVTSGSGGVGGSGTSPPASGSGGGIVLEVGGTTGSGDSGATNGGGDPGKVIMSLPAGFTASELGGYQLGPAIEATAGGSGGGGGGPANGNCGNILLGVIRDFKGANEADGHPDFEAPIAGANVTPALVAGTLGMDRKPVYASKCEIGAADPPDVTLCPYAAQTTSSANFAQWYSNAPNVNAPYTISIFLEPQPDGLFSFESLHYFPVDGVGFDSLGLEYTGEMHNFGFTTEIHTQFRYRGGERFTFQGDDDVWVFINGRLAVDLGGLHSMQRRTIDLDQEAGALGLSVGTIYGLDLFHAERHTDASTFRIDTNLTFVDCGTVVPDPVK